MGREIRRVPPNWQHPKTKRPNYQIGRMEECYQPLHDDDVETAFKTWLEGWAKWPQDEECDPANPYRSFCEWNGEPPDPEYYRPAWKDEEATWYQVYETVSEGTPVTPPFATKEELVDYLVASGDFWDQKRGDGGWKRENAEKFVEAGSACSMVVETTPQGVNFKLPRDGQ